jgi:hypothetical protein
MKDEYNPETGAQSDSLEQSLTLLAKESLQRLELNGLMFDSSYFSDSFQLEELLEREVLR